MMPASTNTGPRRLSGRLRQAARKLLSVFTGSRVFRSGFQRDNSKKRSTKDLSKELPLGWLWNQLSKVTGFGSLGASKLMGLVGYGKFYQYYYDVFETMITGEVKEKN